MFPEKVQKAIDDLNRSREFWERMRRCEVVHKVLMLQGRLRFGEPSEDVRLGFWVLRDMARLERIAARIFDATGWEDLLATP
jgi:hypothetical protein